MSVITVISIYYAIDAQNQLSDASTRLDALLKTSNIDTVHHDERGNRNKVQVVEMGGNDFGEDMLSIKGILKLVHGALQQAGQAIAEEISDNDEDDYEKADMVMEMNDMIQEAVEDFRGPIEPILIKLPAKGQSIQELDKAYAKQVEEEEEREDSYEDSEEYEQIKKAQEAYKVFSTQ